MAAIVAVALSQCRRFERGRRAAPAVASVQAGIVADARRRGGPERTCCRRASDSPDEGPSDRRSSRRRPSPLRFNHKKHATMGVQCQTCHAGGPTSDSAQDSLIPSPQHVRRLPRVGPLGARARSSLARPPRGAVQLLPHGLHRGRRQPRRPARAPARQPRLHPPEAPREEHRVRRVPRRDRPARARHARPAAAHGWLLRVPPGVRLGGGACGEERVHDVPPP